MPSSSATARSSSRTAGSNKAAKTQKKITVGRQRICSERTIKLIDPVWMPGLVPFRFWQDRNNRRNYLLWLGHRLGFRRMEDWYKIRHEFIRQDHGAGLSFAYWNSSAIVGVKECFPQYDWKDWLFAWAPRAFWKNQENHRPYMEWLGERLGYERRSDWYQVKQDDFPANHGNGLIRCYNGSPTALLRDLFPRTQWNEWMFSRVPFGFWDDPENRKRYVTWLGKQLGFRCPTDWYRIRSEDFKNNYGGSLICSYKSHFDLLEECLPELDWESMRRRPLTEEQILRWAGAHHRRTGKWPSRDSALIDGANRDTWCAVIQALKKGRRGLKGGSSLAKLLKKHGLC